MTSQPEHDRRYAQRRQFNAESTGSENQISGLDTTERRGLRSQTDRRQGERRKANMGPPTGMSERRFCPDLRGVVFPAYYNR